MGTTSRALGSRTRTLRFSIREEAELRRLVWRAFDLRGEPTYGDALTKIERWYVETLPDRLEESAGTPRTYELYAAWRLTSPNVRARRR